MYAGERGVCEIPGRVLSQELFIQVSITTQSTRQHPGWTRLLEDALLHLRARRTQLLRDVHHWNDHYQQPSPGQTHARFDYIITLCHSLANVYIH